MLKYYGKMVSKMTAREAVRKMKAQGWYIQEEGRKHTKWTHEKLFSRPYIPVPRHGSQELSRGVETEIINAMKEVEGNMKGDRTND
jgi:predicted RNA binding protein YcfA (HicA-like mRNA interferase family)